MRQELIQAPGDAVLFWSGLTVLAMVLLRQMLALRENDSLRRSLERRVDEVLHERGNLKQSEERFRLLVDNVKDYAMFMLDPDGYVVSWNAGAARIKGYTREEIVGNLGGPSLPL